MKVWDQARIELTAPGSAVRHVTNLATRPGPPSFTIDIMRWFVWAPKTGETGPGCSGEPSRRDGFLELPGHVFKLKNKKITILHVKVHLCGPI